MGSCLNFHHATGTPEDLPNQEIPTSSPNRPLFPAPMRSKERLESQNRRPPLIPNSKSLLGERAVSAGAW